MANAACGGSSPSRFCQWPSKRVSESMSLDDFPARLKAARQGEDSALTQLYEAFADRVYRYIYFRVSDPHEAEDLAEDVFLRMLEAIGKCRVETEGMFIAWLFRIAHNVTLNYLKRRRPQQPLSEELADGRDEPFDQAERRLTYEHLRRALRALTEDQQSVIWLKFIEGLSNSEIALALVKNENAVKALQYRALKALYRNLAPRGEVAPE
ncbi:MAG: RNA polymerase subunit sigma-24 [Chloroflexota bacterium]